MFELSMKRMLVIFLYMGLCGSCVLHVRESYLIQFYIFLMMTPPIASALLLQSCFASAEGKSLAESLVSAGLARAHGEDADFPDAEGKRRIWKALHELEAAAKHDGQGIFRNSRYAKPDRNALKPLREPSKAEPKEPVKQPAKEFALKPAAQGQLNSTSDSLSQDRGDKPAVPETISALVDINSASEEALIKLPQIGDSLAKKIIEARPFSSKADVKRVKGIGEGKYAAIKDLIEAK